MKKMLAVLFVAAAWAGRYPVGAAEEDRGEGLLGQAARQAAAAVQDNQVKKELEPGEALRQFEALRLFSDSAEVKAAIAYKQGEGFVALGEAHAAVLHLAFGDEGYSMVYLVTLPMGKGTRPQERMTANIAAVVVIDVFAKKVKVVDSSALWDAVRPLIH